MFSSPIFTSLCAYVIEFIIISSFPVVNLSSEKLSTIPSFIELFTEIRLEKSFFSFFTEKRRFVKAGGIWYYYLRAFTLSTIILFWLGIMLITYNFLKHFYVRFWFRVSVHPDAKKALFSSFSHLYPQLTHTLCTGCG